MNLIGLHNLVRNYAKSNSSLILSSVAGVGVLATAFLASKATVQAVDVIRSDAQNPDTWHLESKDLYIRRAKLVWKFYIPPAVSASTTIACIVGANRIDTKKILAAQTAFAMSDRAYSEYRDKVIQEYGEKKDEKIRDSIVEDRVKATPSTIIAGSGKVLCCELYTMRYFENDIESLRKAENEINKQILSQDRATLDDLYYILGLSKTTESSNLGWRSNRLLELVFTSVLSETGQPCLAFEYSYIQPL